MKRSPIQHILDDVVRLKRDAWGNPRFFIPAVHMPIGPGAQAGNDIGLYKYRGFNLGRGFVIQSCDLENDLIRVLGVLGVNVMK
ncbi:hypothetical protein ACOI1H_04470 [Loktanella sp. DJP18]|uniref:hypothetical protein n=1 Tax=Loktanella sp. DJP18 TaxID=3409788 RepID=UPI003BB54863